MISQRMVGVPTKLQVCEDREEVLEEIRGLGPMKPVVATGTTSGPLLGDWLTGRLQGGERVLVTDNSFDTVKKLVTACLDRDADAVFGVGGGRVIDAGKLAAHKLGIPFVSVPTQVSHDGLCSPVSVISFSGPGTKSISATMPVAVFFDRTSLAKASLLSWQAGIGDLMSNLSACKDWRLAESELGETVDDYAYLLAKVAAEGVMHPRLFSGAIEDSLEPLVEGLVLSGIAMSIAGSSRPCSGAEHKISHALDHLFGARAPHGLQVAVGTIFAEMIREADDVSLLLEVFEAAGIPTDHQALGFTDEEMVQGLLLAPAMRADRWTVLEAVGMGPDRARDLVKKLKDLR